MLDSRQQVKWINNIEITRGSPVQRNAAKVQDGRSGQLDVQRGAHQAEDVAIAPVAGGQLDGGKGHHHHCHQQVGKSQRHNEVVGLLLPGEVWREVEVDQKTFF